MALLTDQIIGQDILRLLKNGMSMGSLVRSSYDERFAKKGAKIGDTFSVRRPSRYTVGTGETITPQNLEEKSVPITVDKRHHVALQFGDTDRTLSLDKFRERHLAQPVAALANKIDSDLCGLYIEVPNYVGVHGTTPTTVDTYLDAGVLMDEIGVPREGRAAVLSPKMQGELVKAVDGNFNPQAKISGYITKGMIAKQFLGFDFYMDQNIKRHTAGLSATSTPLVNGANQTGANIVTDGWAASTVVLKRGDIVSFAGVYFVNPMSYEATPTLAQFVVTADVTSDGAGAATIPVYVAGSPTEGLVISGPYQNVSGSPANNAAITHFGKAAANLGDVSGVIGAQGLAFHPEAFELVMVDLEMAPSGGGVRQERYSDPDLGISILMSQATQIGDLKTITRLDVLYGVKAVYPEMAVRVLGA